MTLLPVTVVVPTKNEEANLDRCLQRLHRFSHVIVVDSSSTDQTQKIARDHGAEVLNFCWDGSYPKKRNWLLINHPPSTPWVLFLDADELVNDEFCGELAAATATSRHDGFWLNYTNYFLGRQLRYGVPQRKLALFRVGRALYERIEENAWSKLDMEIHEHPVLEGTIGEITIPIEHNDDRGLAKFIDRHRDYALWEARRISLVEKGGIEWKRLTKRQRFKYSYLPKWWFPLFYFIVTYLLKAGFLDGKSGFAYAFYKAWYFYTIRLLIEEDSSRMADVGTKATKGLGK